MPVTRTLVLDLQEITGQTLTDAVVSVAYDRDVRTPGGGMIPRLPTKPLSLSERSQVTVVASDDPGLAPESTGFRVKVVVRRGFPDGAQVYFAQVLTASPATVPLSSVLVPASTTPGDLLHGPPGPSAYEVAVKNGYAGTEAQWLQSLVGPPATVAAPVVHFATFFNGTTDNTSVTTPSSKNAATVRTWAAGRADVRIDLLWRRTAAVGGEWLKILELPAAVPGPPAGVEVYVQNITAGGAPARLKINAGSRDASIISTPAGTFAGQLSYST